MLHSPILKSHFGKHYSLQTRNQTIVRGPLTPEIFWDLHYTQQFIRSLRAPEGYWRRLAQQFDTLSRAYSKSDIEIEWQVCQLLLTGRLQIFEVEAPNMVEHPPEKRVIKDKAGVIYRFSPASVLLTSQPRETQHFSDAAQAQQFLGGLNASEEQLVTIAGELKMALPAGATVSRVELITGISRALVKGEAIIVVDRVSTAPASEQAVETADTNSPGNRQAGLGPETEKGIILASQGAVIPNKFGEIYAKAPAAKIEIDEVADDIAEMFGGQVAKAPIKSQERAIQKIMHDYAGDATRIKDLARNTIIVSPDKVDSVVAELAKRGANVKVIDGAEDPLGYSGVNSTIKTQTGIVGEIQVNTPAMIYAKESEPMARTLLGDELYTSMAAKSEIPGGQGHKLYEQWRVLPDADPGRLAIEAQSKAYYDSVRGTIYGN